MRMALSREQLARQISIKGQYGTFNSLLAYSLSAIWSIYLFSIMSRILKLLPAKYFAGLFDTVKLMRKFFYVHMIIKKVRETNTKNYKIGNERKRMKINIDSTNSTPKICIKR